MPLLRVTRLSLLRQCQHAPGVPSGHWEKPPGTRSVLHAHPALLPGWRRSHLSGRTQFGKVTRQEQFAFIPSLLRGISRTFALPLQLYGLILFLNVSFFPPSFHSSESKTVLSRSEKRICLTRRQPKEQSEKFICHEPPPVEGWVGTDTEMFPPQLLMLGVGAAALRAQGLPPTPRRGPDESTGIDLHPKTPPATTPLPPN